jgi:hypothetical protein
VGALIASRHPKNPVGWICLAVGLFWMETFLEDSIPGSGPYPVTTDALTQSLWIPPWGCSASTLSCSSPTVSTLRGGGVRWPGQTLALVYFGRGGRLAVRLPCRHG